MTTTNRIRLQKAQNNKNGNKMMKYIIAGTILLFSIAIFIACNCTATFLTY
jgi:hypothetical protein